MSNAKKTGVNSHRATQRGYAFDAKSKSGLLVEEGDFVPAGQVVSDAWMEEAEDEKPARAAKTAEEAPAS